MALAREAKQARGVLAFLATGATVCLATLPAKADQADARFEAMALNAQGRYEAACALLEKSIPQTPNDPDVLFLLGQCRAGLGEYAAARAAYQKVLTLDPSAERVRFEIAETYRQEGLARQERATYRDLLKADLPTDIRLNIERSLFQSLQDRPWTLQTAVFGIYDSNVNGGPDEREIEAFGLPFTLNDESLNQEASGVGFGASGGYSWFGEKELALVARGSFSRRDYEEAEFDTETASVSLGPVYSSDRARIAVLPRLTVQFLGGEIYRSSYGIDMEGRYALQPRWTVQGSLGASLQDYQTSADRDGTQIYGFLGLGYRAKDLALTAGYQVAEETADAETDSNVAHGPRVSLSTRLFERMTARLTYQYTETNYEAEEAAFGVVREDETHTVDGRISVPVTAEGVEGVSLDGGITYADNNSTVDINSYEREVITLGLSKRW